MRGNHAVKTDLARQTLELVSVGVAGTVHVDVVFRHLLSVRRHIVIGVFDRFGLGKRRGSHAYNGDKEKNYSLEIHNSFLFWLHIFRLMKHYPVSGFQVDFHGPHLLCQILADTVDKSAPHIGGNLRTGIGGDIYRTAHR